MKLMRSNSPVLSNLPQLFDDFFARDLFDWGTRNFSLTDTTIPAVNVFENNEAFIVEVAAPGMDKKDFKIELDNEVLTISSEKEMEDEVDNGQYSRREFSYQAFQRSFRLPKSVVDDGKIKAKYQDGILRVLIPKREEAKAQPPRKIAVQ